MLIFAKDGRLTIGGFMKGCEKSCRIVLPKNKILEALKVYLE